ncbi:hypothetical protein PVK06_017175 [Gossypium arboreum]|nr:hypothetical protein PVK06_017175 [Gossypium arboreum]
MDSATVHEEIDSFFESTSPLEDFTKIIDKLNQFIQFDYSSGEEKGRKVEELLK